MKILLVISSLSGGGAERVMAWLAGRLVEDGNSVWLVTRHPASLDFYDLHPSVRRIVVRRSARFNIPKVRAVETTLWWWRSLRTIARQERIDVALSFIDAMNISVLIALVGTGVPVVVSERTDPRHSQLKLIGQKLRPHVYRQLSKRVVVQTDAFAAQLRQSWRLRSVSVIPNAVLLDTDGAPAAVERRSCVLSVGRFTSEKGHDVLIDAWARVASEFPDWTLRLVGDGPLRRSLEERIANHGLGSSVCLPGVSRDVAQEYRSASIFVLPSRVEGFPNALLEAMAFGCAPVASDIAGVRMAIDAGRSGVLVPSGDAEALAQELRHLMRNADLRRAYAERATAVADLFAPDRVFELWRTTLAEVAASCPGFHSAGRNGDHR